VPGPDLSAQHTRGLKEAYHLVGAGEHREHSTLLVAVPLRAAYMYVSYTTVVTVGFPIS